MSTKDQTITGPESLFLSAPQGAALTDPVDVITILWSYAEPDRIGEIALLGRSPRGSMLGRGHGDAESARVEFLRQRPGALERREPLRSQSVSRDQLHLVVSDAGLSIEQRGRCALIVNGKHVDRAHLAPGQTFSLRGQLLFSYTRRPGWIPALKFYHGPAVWPFGNAEPAGIVGETPAMWKLRDELAFHAQSDKHVLVTGPSGTGKELAARAIHLLSDRAARPMIARNAAALPPALIDAELFGNARNYPNPGMAERPGLIGEADGSTLFLDEIGEMPPECQAHLLRVLDRDGEYQRLGETRARRSDFRLIAATNRDPSVLKHDFLSRLVSRSAIPSLHDRREDIPLLVRHLMKQLAERHLHARTFFDGPNAARSNLRIAPELIENLVLRDYTTHMRELEGILLRAVGESQGPYLGGSSRGGGIEKGRSDSQTERPTEPPAIPAPSRAAPDEVPCAQKAAIMDALERNNWVIRRAWRDLGLTSRYQLYRLMDKYDVKREPRSSET